MSLFINGWKLQHAGTEIAMEVGDTITSRHATYTITGGCPPHKPSSSGRVFTENSDGDAGAYFPHVFDLEWVKA